MNVKVKWLMIGLIIGVSVWGVVIWTLVLSDVKL